MYYILLLLLAIIHIIYYVIYKYIKYISISIILYMIVIYPEQHFRMGLDRSLITQQYRRED